VAPFPGLTTEKEPSGESRWWLDHSCKDDAIWSKGRQLVVFDGKESLLRPNLQRREVVGSFYTPLHALMFTSFQSFWHVWPNTTSRPGLRREAIARFTPAVGWLISHACTAYWDAFTLRNRLTWPVEDKSMATEKAIRWKLANFHPPSTEVS
jgi:hypothetical protein